MRVLLYLLLPVLVVATWAVAMWARNRQPTSVESGVDAFRREMQALSPDAAPGQRRRIERPDVADSLPTIAGDAVAPSDAPPPGRSTIEGADRPHAPERARPPANPPRRAPRPPGRDG